MRGAQFGLGPAGGPIRSVTINWPSGAKSVHENLDVDRYWLLEPSSPAARPL